MVEVYSLSTRSAFRAPRGSLPATVYDVTRRTTTLSTPLVVDWVLVSAHCSPGLAPAFTQGKKSVRKPCTRAAAGDTFTASSVDSLPAVLRNAWNSAPRALSNTLEGMGLALSPRIESTTTRTVLPPAVSARVTVRKLAVENASRCRPFPAAVASMSWVRVWSTRKRLVTGARQAGAAPSRVAQVVNAASCRARIGSVVGVEAGAALRSRSGGPPLVEP